MKSLACALSLLVCGFAAAAAAQTADTPRRGGVIAFPVQGDPDSWDCHAAQSVTSLHRLAPLYSLLVKTDTKNYPAVAPDLAESWTISPDGLTYTFKIRSGVKFHDGSPLTSEDIKVTYDRMRAPPTGVVSVRQRLFTGIASIDTPDAQTVVFKLSRPNTSMLTIFASPWNCIYSAQLLKSNPNYPGKLVMGSGAFQFASYTPGADWVGKRFDGYFQQGKPYLDGFRAIDGDRPAMVNALSAGQLQADFRGVTVNERDRIRASRGDKVKFLEGPWTVLGLVAFNTTKPPFDDARVRKALTLAIDRWGNAQPMGAVNGMPYVGGFLRPGYSLALPPAELEKYPGFSHDIEKSRAEARALLAQAGQSNLSFTFTSRDNQVAQGVFFIDQWKRIGVNVTQDMMTNARYAAARVQGGYVAILDSSNEFIDDPAIQLSKYLSKDISAANYGNYVDRTLDALFEKQAIAKSDAERVTAARDFEARLLNESYSIPVYWYERIVALDAAVQGYYLTPSYQVGQDLTDLWLKQ